MTKRLVLHNDSSQKHTLDLTTLRTGIHQGSKSLRLLPEREKLLERGKKSNDGLLTSLADNFYLYKTKQSNSKDRHTHNHTHIQDLYWTSTCMYLTVDLRGWKVYWKQSMHIIHIYIYPGP